MVNGFIDIPFAALEAALFEIKNTKRKFVCKVLPRARFNLWSDGSIDMAANPSLLGGVEYYARPTPERMEW